MMTLTFAERIQASGIERFDSVIGKVIKQTAKGALLSFGDFVGFAYTSLPINTQVLCSIRRIYIENEFILLDVDSVFDALVA